LAAVSKVLRKAAVILWLSAAGATAVYAASPWGEVTPLASVSVARATLSMDQAVQMVEQRYHARVVRAQTQNEEGRTVYVLRLLNDSGKVWTVHVDAANGSVF
jgi:uncharacterized membrane protein YkoI